MDASVVEAVLFDLGGTLLHYQDGDQPDFRRMTRRGLARVRRGLIELGHEPPEEDAFADAVDQHIGAAYVESMNTLRGGSIETPIQVGLQELGMAPTGTQWADLRERFYSVVDEIMVLREGARETLKALQDGGYKLALISNTYWAADLHDRHLGEYGLLEFLPQRTYSSETRYTKPHPSIFHGALESLGVAPERALYVGDRLDIDVGGAQQAGMQGVLIMSPYLDYTSDEATKDIQPDATIHELLALLDKLTQ